MTERNSRYLIGITYPAVASEHRKLAKALSDYAQSARQDLDDAVKLAGDSVGSGGNTYDLSLNFIELMNTPAAVVVAVDGSLYTGGAHGIPLIARFTYLPQEDRMLTPQDLVSEPSGWQAISDYVRKQLGAQVEARLEEDEVPEAERAEIIRSASNMIEEGTMPDAANFAQFEPIPAADGKWFGLRFVFPPYQVGPYSDGTQSVEVPVSILRPHLMAKYRIMFTGF
ncbi:MAG: RsiV family protein [Pseudomonadota bacterium]|nr:RsiV family protein [Pseudomonadota bacterium]